jgi:hypothetical protein
MTFKKAEGYNWAAESGSLRREWSDSGQIVQEMWVADAGSLAGGNVDFSAWDANNPSSGIFLPVRIDARP